MEIYLIVGLGNPDKKYEETRHNAGFNAINKLAEKLGTRISEKKFKGLSASVVRNGQKLLLLKPQTYMNLSGESVAEAANYFNIEPDHIIVLYDDINFACGRMRVRGQGSAGGHNGIKSIIACIGNDGFPRVRIGVGAKREQTDLAAHVLGRFAGKDKETMDKAFSAAGDAALCIIDKGVAEAMNEFNGIDLAPQTEEETKA